VKLILIYEWVCDRGAEFRGVLFESGERFPFYVQASALATHCDTLYNKILMAADQPNY